jgi:hypothetical protein
MQLMAEAISTTIPDLAIDTAAGAMRRQTAAAGHCPGKAIRPANGVAFMHRRQPVFPHQTRLPDPDRLTHIFAPDNS